MDRSIPTDWFIDSLKGIQNLQRSINSVSTPCEDEIEKILIQGQELIQKQLPGSHAGILKSNEKNRYISFTYDSAELVIENLPTSLVEKAILSQEVEFSDEIPTGVHITDEWASACGQIRVDDGEQVVLVILSPEVKAYTQEEKQFIRNIHELTGNLLQKRSKSNQLRKEIERKNEELMILRRASMLISSRLRLEETLETILQMALEMTSAEYGIFRLVDINGQNLITRAFVGENLARPLVESMPVDSQTVTGWVAKNREPVCISDLRSADWKDLYYPLDALTEMRSELAVPLIHASGRLEGVLNLESQQVAGFDDQDVHLLQSLATQAVIAIEEARLLDVLQDITQHLLTQSNTLVLQRILDLCRDLLYADSSALWILLGDKLVLAASSGEQPVCEHLELEETFPGKAILERQVQELTLGKCARCVSMGVEAAYSGLAVELSTSNKEHPLGALAVYTSDAKHGDITRAEWNKKALQLLAQYATLSIQNSNRQDALKAAQEKHAVSEMFAAMGDVSANVLHNLNNKVGTIPVRVQGIKSKRAGIIQTDPYLSTNLDEIERSANEAMESVRESLAHLRPITLAETDIHVCVEEALSMAKLPEGIKIEMEGLTQLPRVQAARSSLVLVFVNLFGNANEAIRGAGEIHVWGKSENKEVVLTISDNGPGIPLEIKDKIFDLDFSGRRSGNNHKLGFGLWWVKTLMTRLGGSVSVRTENGPGTTFELRLPIL
jgi:signal transduction histidine kinase/putative methionine-R-sulfoxide reductase with GAF domain